METPVQPGFRVIRGPDWSYKDQDGGKGHAGTVVRLQDVHRPHFPPNSVLVQWDNGDKGLYRVGYDRAYDLRIFETANSVRHPKVWCDGCETDEIRGIRWRCTECYAIDLCTTCYMNDEHDLSHVFMRVLSSHETSMGPKMLPRSSSPRIPLRGSFPGATVVRHPQGYKRVGSDKQLGKVLKSGQTAEEKAKVQVAVDLSSIVESMSFTEIVCKLPGSGGYVYDGHLPYMGDLEPVNEGDKVLVTANPEELEKLHKRRRLWEPDMVKTLRRKGFINRRTNSGDFEVAFSDTQETYIMNSAALRKIHHLFLGQLVRISDDMEMVKRLQYGHGGWTAAMKKVIGKVGKVVNIDGSDIHVKTKDNHKFIFNATNLTPTTFHACEWQEGSMAEAFCGLSQERTGSEMEVNIRLAVASGDISALERILDKNPEWVHYGPEPGMPLICHAASKGDVRLVKFLVEKGAFIESYDEQGITPLLHATGANKPENVKYLLEQGADVNATNHRHFTSFSHASSKGFFQCAQYLLMHGSDMNHKGDEAVTAVMASGDSGRQNMVDLIMDRKEADLKAVSKSLISTMHGVATNDNTYAIRKLLDKVPRLVEARDAGARTPLFHAVFKGSRNAAELLIKQGHCDVNAREKFNGFSPLMAALVYFQFHLVDVLVKNGADPNMRHRSGNTSLQVTFTAIERAQEKHIKEETYMAEMKKKWGHLGIKTNGDALVAFLVSHGADLDAYNAGGITIRQLLSMTQPALLHPLAEIQAQRGKDIARQQSTANRPLRHVTKKTDSNDSGGNSLSTLLKKSTARSESKEQSSRNSPRLVSTSSGSEKKIQGKESTDVKQIGSARPGVKDSSTGDLHQLRAELRRKDEELATLRSKVETLEHLVKKKIVFTCGHDVIRSIAELIPECPNCSEPITSVVDLQ